jgi:hypothetical protein
VKAHWNIDFLFLLESASKTTGAVSARFFIMSLDIRKKFIERSMSQKTAWKSGICSNIYLFCTKTEAKFKKRSLMAPAVFDALSNKKNIWLCIVLW